MQSDTVTFSAAVRAVGQEARRMGLAVPGFRSPPGLVGVDRTIRRPHGEPIIAIRVRGRPAADIVADIVEGVLVANDVSRVDGRRLRHSLLEAVEGSIRSAA